MCNKSTDSNNLSNSLNCKKSLSVALVAHVDHGKTTLARSLISQLTQEKAVTLLDNMSVEQMRGITIKSKLLTLFTKIENDFELVVNLVDTPGHVDFYAETQRSMLVTDLILILVDSTKGLQAQSIANFNLATELKRDIIFVITKIDVSSSDAKKTIEQIKVLRGENPFSIVEVSAKTGVGMPNLLKVLFSKSRKISKQIVNKFQAFIFDAFYDEYLGVVFLVRIMAGKLKLHDVVRINNSIKQIKVDNLGKITTSGFKKLTNLSEGELGYVCCSLKKIEFDYLGGFLTKANETFEQAILSYKPAKPILFSNIYPLVKDDYGKLKKAIEKLGLNDCSVSIEPESSKTMGFGFKCGFMGSLHLEVFLQRLEDEHKLDCITSVPSVEYEVKLKTGETIFVKSANAWPGQNLIEKVSEQFVKVTIITDAKFLGNVMTLLTENRGEFLNLEYIDQQNVNITASLPLIELISGFAESLKSVSSGYASLSYELTTMRETQLEKLDILIGGEVVESLSSLVYAPHAVQKGRKIVSTLKESIPRQLFEVAIQAAIGKKVIARETVKALRKDVLAKCYGGDITRKKKLLEKQKRGKERMQQFGKVKVPKEAFIAVLKIQ